MPTVTTRLEQPAGADDGATTIGDLLIDSTPGPADTAHNNIERASQRRDLQRTLNLLPAFQKHVITRRYGLLAHPAQTLARVARDLGATRNDVRDAEEHALAALDGWAADYRQVPQNPPPSSRPAVNAEPDHPLHAVDAREVELLRGAYQATHRSPSTEGKGLRRHGAATRTVRTRSIFN